MEALTAQAFADWLKEHHRGRGKAITARNLVVLWTGMYNVDDREIRKLASAACEEGRPVFADSKGYFYAENREEAAEAFNRLEHQAKSMLLRVSKGRAMLDAEGHEKIGFGEKPLGRELFINGISLELVNPDGSEMTARQKFDVLRSGWLKIYLGEWCVFDTALSRWPCRRGIPCDPVEPMRANVAPPVKIPAEWPSVLRVEGPAGVRVFFYENAGTADEIVVSKVAEVKAGAA